MKLHYCDLNVPDADPGRLTDERIDIICASIFVVVATLACLVLGLLGGPAWVKWPLVAADLYAVCVILARLGVMWSVR